MPFGNFFSWLDPVITKETFEHNTQFAQMHMKLPLKKVCKYLSPDFNANCCSGQVACGTLYRYHNSVDDEPTIAVTLVSCQFYVKYLHDTQKDFQFADTLEDNTQDQGVRLILTCDFSVPFNPIELCWCSISIQMKLIQLTL